MALLFDPSNHVEVKIMLIGATFTDPLPSIQMNKFGNFDATILKMRETAYVLFAARPEIIKIRYEVMGVTFEIINELPPEKEKTLKELYPNAF